MSHKIVIVGAGLVGAMLAIALKRRGWDICLYEKRSDPEASHSAEGRSINLIITTRGRRLLAEHGLWQEVATITTPVKGRMMHDQKGGLKYQPYGIYDHEVNHSVSRSELNLLLIRCAKQRGVNCVFDHALESADFKKRQLVFNHGGRSVQVRYDLCFGADGAGSRVRQLMDPQQNTVIEPLGASYKELKLQPQPHDHPGFQADYLHIWPRGRHMLMGLPNKDHSFTMTLYLPDEGALSFAEIDPESYFQTYHPDSLPHFKDFQEQFHDNPVGRLATVFCPQWHRPGVLLMGDAAHGIVPFFGQGMNAGFEDISVLEHMLEEDQDINLILQAFAQKRPRDTQAIAEMAIENFQEMAEKVGDERFLLKKRFEHAIESARPKLFRSRYAMVTFSYLPYSLVQELGRIHDGLLEELMARYQRVEALDFAVVDDLLAAKQQPFLKAQKVQLDL